MRLKRILAEMKHQDDNLEILLESLAIGTTIKGKIKEIHKKLASQDSGAGHILSAIYSAMELSTEGEIEKFNYEQFKSKIIQYYNSAMINKTLSNKTILEQIAEIICHISAMGESLVQTIIDRLKEKFVVIDAETKTKTTVDLTPLSNAMSSAKTKCALPRDIERGEVLNATSGKVEKAEFMAPLTIRKALIDIRNSLKHHTPENPEFDKYLVTMANRLQEVAKTSSN
jgi:hypothetical protein